ncbi:IclR family transcriptional regulator [Microbacterium sp. NPDC090218]
MTVNNAQASEDRPTNAYSVRAVDRVCDILDMVADATEGLTLTEIADGVALPKSSTFRYLTALESRRYLHRDESSGMYRLGLAFRPQNTRSVELLSEIARPILAKLRAELGETTNLGVLDGSSITHLVVEESPHMMRLAAREGERGDIYATALGKVIATMIPATDVNTILDLGMPRITAKTITDRSDYFKELERVKTVGYGLDDEENQEGGRCIAVAVDGTGFRAGISVSAPISRMPLARVDEVAAALHEAARAISRRVDETRP